MNTFVFSKRSQLLCREFGSMLKKTKQPKHKTKLKIHGASVKYTLPTGIGGKESLINGPMYI